MTETLNLRGDDARGSSDLLELRHLAASNEPAGAVFLDYTEEAIEWRSIYKQTNPNCRFVFFSPRSEMNDVMAKYPDLSILPAPGTALAARCLVSAAPDTDPACELGDYQLIEIQALDSRSHIFRALQRSIQRPVVLRLLNQENEIDEAALNAFLDDARAKAAINHDRVGAVFQALEDRGSVFYTAESIEGTSLHSMAAAGQTLPPRQVLDVARTVASALAHVASKNLNCAPIELRHIHLSGPQSTPRLANPATLGTATPGTWSNILQHTFSLLAPLVDAAASHSGEVQTWLSGVAARPAGSVDPSDIVSEIRNQIAHMEDRVPAATSARTQPGKPPRSTTLMVGAAVLALAIIGWIISAAMKKPPQRVVGDTETIVSFAGGEFEHPEMGTIRFAPFNIDKYEVTIRQYAEFLQAIASQPPAENPEPKENQRPEKKSHEPADWSVYYPIAVTGGEFGGRKLTLDCPVFNVDWRNAAAYAKWRNRRLPTQEEWELVARGNSWRKYPWGDQWSAAKANSADKPVALEEHQAWSPVDLPEGDRTPENVAGLAGNVSEWTSSEAVHPEDPNRTVPVVKGGSFMTRGDIDAGKRVSVLSRNEQKTWLGFRTATTLSNP
ncbi:MAG: SUMF1/EgtB/PvdO family nonheme iron enzyme [Verrucomicrobiales bacterium]